MHPQQLIDQIHWLAAEIYAALPLQLQTYLEQLKARLYPPYEAQPCLEQDNLEEPQPEALKPSDRGLE
jgi:hypothetical protein